MKKLALSLAGRRILVILGIVASFAPYFITEALHENSITSSIFGTLGGLSLAIYALSHKYLFINTNLWKPGIFEKWDKILIIITGVALFCYLYFTVAISFLPLWIPKIEGSTNISIFVSFTLIIAQLPSKILAWREKEVEVIE